MTFVEWRAGLIYHEQLLKRARSSAIAGLACQLLEDALAGLEAPLSLVMAILIGLLACRCQGAAVSRILALIPMTV